ncbi:MAG: PIG-L deacetylase family protein [Acidimicrobiia bacterium]
MTLRLRLADAHRRFLVLRARDMTDATATRSAAVLTPHPDDETIGCGATIARKTAAGTRVLVVVAADGRNSMRRRECIAACDRLGVPEADVRFLGLPDGGLESCRDELVTALSAELRDVDPAEFYLPSAIDHHPDHRALSAALDALGPDAVAGRAVYEYPVWFWSRWAWVDGGSPARQLAQWTRRVAVHAVKVRPRTVSTRGFLDIKRTALECFPSQLRRPGSTEGLDPEWLKLFLGSRELFFERA